MKEKALQLIILQIYETINQNVELSSTELLLMFEVEELDDRLEMCWVNCQTNTCTIQSNTTNTTCCGNQGNTIGDIGVPVNGSCTPPPSEAPEK